MDTAAVLVIGNEVLSGKVDEENACFLIDALRSCGVRLERVVFVRDDIVEIAGEVRAMAERYTHVFTTGGVGGTHDDITMPAVAEAFGVPLETHPELAELLKKHYGPRLNEALRRLARVPAGTELVYGEEARVPAVRFRNVFVLPGAPKFLRSKFPLIEPLLVGREVWLAELFLDTHEELVADVLSQADGMEDDVEVGSYPRFDEEADHKVKITVEGSSLPTTDRVFRYLADAWLESQVVIRSVPPRRVGGPKTA